MNTETKSLENETQKVQGDNAPLGTGEPTTQAESTHNVYGVKIDGEQGLRMVSNNLKRVEDYIAGKSDARLVVRPSNEREWRSNDSGR